MNTLKCCKKCASILLVVAIANAISSPDYWRDAFASIDIQDESDLSDMDGEGRKKIVDKGCSTMSTFEECLETKDDYDKSRPDDDDSIMTQYADIGKRPNPTFQHGDFPPCFCEKESKLLELGKNYFPSYLQTTVCKSGHCWRNLYHCHQKNYTAQVLRKRGESQSIKFPSRLVDAWIPDTIEITVACECKP